MASTTTSSSTNNEAIAEADLWLFGYGSLIWKPPPHFDKRVPGFVEGYVRRFWQASEDHRGTPSAPGRVVTLIPRAHWEEITDSPPNASLRVWGAAYRIPGPRVKEVKELLDIREINGYTVDYAAFHVRGEGHKDAPATINCLVYIGLPSNPQFLGPQDQVKLAQHIVRSKGPSGENKEYVYELEKALDELRRETGEDVEIDGHVKDLAAKVRSAERALADEDPER